MLLKRINNCEIDCEKVQIGVIVGHSFQFGECVAASATEEMDTKALPPLLVPRHL